MNKILVMDGQTIAALAIIRSLGEKGFEIHCGEDFRYNLSSFSKYVKKAVVYPSPVTRPDQFCDFVLNLTKQERYNLIIPVADDTTLLLSKYKEKFLRYTKLYLADFSAVSKLGNKGEAIKIAQKLSIPVPATYFPEDTGIEEIKNRVKYPVLIRPRISSGSRGIKYVSSRSKFDIAYKQVENEYGNPIVQEYISHDGGHYSIGVLFDRDSKPVAIHVYKELKQYPLQGGTAAVAVSIKKERWVDYFLEILRSMKWVGPAHMDVLYDSASNTPRLLEINPRFWMSLNLSVKAGVDFPYLLYKLTNESKFSPVSLYKEGLIYRWIFPNEILWLTQTSRKREGFKEFINFWDKNTCYGDLSLDDPMPVIGIIHQSIHFLSNSDKRKMIFRRGWSL